MLLKDYISGEQEAQDHMSNVSDTRLMNSVNQVYRNHRKRKKNQVITRLLFVLQQPMMIMMMFVHSRLKKSLQKTKKKKKLLLLHLHLHLQLQRL
jgi:hypothetical protein